MAPLLRRTGEVGLTAVVLVTLLCQLTCVVTQDNDDEPPTPVEVPITANQCVGETEEAGITCLNGGHCSPMSVGCVCEGTCFEGPTCASYNNEYAPVFAQYPRGLSAIMFRNDGQTQTAPLPPATDMDLCSPNNLMDDSVPICACTQLWYEIAGGDENVPPSLFSAEENMLVYNVSAMRKTAEEQSGNLGYHLQNLMGGGTPSLPEDGEYTLLIRVSNKDSALLGEGEETLTSEDSFINVTVQLSAHYEPPSSDTDDPIAYSESLLHPPDESLDSPGQAQGQAQDQAPGPLPEHQNELAHLRKKRTTGVGYSSQYTFDLTMTGSFASATAFDLGDTIPFQIVISASNAQFMQMKLEILSERFWTPVFSISNIQVAYGDNFNDGSAGIVTNYEYRDTTFTYDRATVDLGILHNKQVADTSLASNQITITFDAVVTGEEFLVATNEYWISAGAEYYDGSKIWVAQTKLTYTGAVSGGSMDSGVTPTFSLSGGTTLGLGQATAFTLTMNAQDMYNHLKVDVFAPVNETGIMSVCSMAVIFKGDHYKWREFDQIPANFTTTADSEGVNSHGTLDLGNLLNQGFRKSDTTAAKHDIQVTIIVRMENSSLVTIDQEYWLGVSVTVETPAGTSLVWTEQNSITAITTDVATMSQTPTIALTLTTPEVAVGGSAGYVLNMTLPAGSEAVYEVQVSVPFNDSVARMNIIAVFITFQGFNIPCVRTPVLEKTKTDGTNADYATYNLGIVSNVGVKSGVDDSVLQVGIAVEIVNGSGLTLAGDQLELTVGVKFATYYYVERAAPVTVLAEPTIHTGDESSFLMENKMGSDQLHPCAIMVFHLCMYFKPGTVHGPVVLTARMDTVDNMAAVNLVDVSVVSKGRGLAFTGDLNATMTSSVVDTTDDDSPLFTDAEINLGYATNVLSSDYGNGKLKDSLSTVCVRLLLQARSKHSDVLAAAPNLTMFVSVEYSSVQLYASVATLVYNETEANFFAQPGSPQAEVSVTVDEGSSSCLWGGQVARFTFELIVPSRTTGDYTLSVETTNKSLSMCQLMYVGKSPNILTCESFMSHQANQSVGSLANTSRISDTTVFAEGVSNIATDLWSPEMAKSGDHSLKYTALVHLRDLPGLVAQNYNFVASAKLGTSSWFFNYGTVTADPLCQKSAGAIMPEVFIHSNSDTQVSLGGGIIVTIEVYIPPSSSGDYRLEVFAPANYSRLGTMKIAGSGFISKGVNLVCSTYLDFSYELDASSTNESLLEDHSTINIGFVPSAVDSGPVKLPENMLVFKTYIQTVFGSSLEVGDHACVAVTLTMEGNILVSSICSEVASFVPDSQLMVPPDVVMKNPQEPKTDPIDDIHYHHMGTTETYRIFINTTQGSTVFKFILESPVSEGEPLFSITNLRLVCAGANVNGSIDTESIGNQTSAMGTKEERVELDFATLFNTGMTGDVQVDGLEASDTDGLIELAVDITVLDHLENVDGVASNITYRYTHSDTGGTVVTENQTFSIIPLLYTDDNAIYDWSMWMVGKDSVANGTGLNATNETASVTLANGEAENIVTTVYMPQDTIKICVRVAHANTSARRATNMTIHCRVPFYSLYEDSYNYTGKEPTSVLATEKSVEVHFRELRLDEFSEVCFNVTIDPYGYLPKGLRYETLTIPADIVHYRLNKTHAPLADIWFTQIETISFSVFIPECLEPLGMANENISDCQITASSSVSDPLTGYHGANESRLNLGKGWGPAPRGPPFFREEYIQVDLGADVKVTGIGIQPSATIQASFVQTFTLQWSKEGMRWFNVLDTAQTVKVFEVEFTWENRVVDVSDTVFVPMANFTFIGRYVRVLPQSNSNNSYYHMLRFELYGCPYPYGSILPAYSCLTQPTPLFYMEDRQMLFVPSDSRLFVCTLSSVGGTHKCSYTRNNGVGWYAMDEYVGTLMFYDLLTGKMYAGSTNGISYMKSDNLGDSWYHIETTEFEAVLAGLSLSDMIEPKRVPYEIGDLTVNDLLTAYAYANANDVFVASERGIHYWTDSTLSSTTKTVNEGIVAYWGTGLWISRP